MFKDWISMRIKRKKKIPLKATASLTFCLVFLCSFFNEFCVHPANYVCITHWTDGSDPKIVFILPKISNKNLLWPLYIILKQQICSFIKYIWLVTMATSFSTIYHLFVKSALMARRDGILKYVKLQNIKEIFH